MAYVGPEIRVADSKPHALAAAPPPSPPPPPPPPHRRPPARAAVVLWPSRSIIKQSYDARERLSDASLPSHLGYGNLNGDGFGIGWYSGAPAARADPTPCTFTSVTPAWNNDNLNRCVEQEGALLRRAQLRRL
jgi:hypothetical protein